MATIGGIYNLNNSPVCQQTLNNLGLNNVNIWHKDNLSLFNSNFNTVSEYSYEKMPFKNSNGSLVITSDSRIDNRTELISTLRINEEIDLITDSKIILKSYEKWGENCTKHLLGDFTFAIWDCKNKNLFCARDHFGIKPLYYYYKNNIFVFCSEIKPIINLDFVNNDINEGRIADFLSEYLEGIDKTSTFYKFIKKLKPATSITVSKNKFTFKNYWSLNPDKPVIYNNQNDYYEAFIEKFSNAVKRRIKNRSNVGITLSGGLDSSSIVVVADSLVDKKNLTILSGTLENTKDIYEKPYIEDVLSMYNLKNHYITEDYILNYREEFYDYLTNINDLFDANMNLIIPICMYAKKIGTNVINFGIDGDSVTSERISSVSSLIYDFSLISLIKEIYGYSKINNIPITNLTWNHVIKPIMPSFFKSLGKSLFKSNDILHKDFLTHINKDFKKNIKLEERFNCLKQNNTNFINKNIPLYKQNHYSILNQSYLNVAIDRYTRVSSNFGIEARFPFFDIEFVEFCLNLPINLKIDKGINKAVLRNSLNNLLPHSITNKKDSYHLGPFYQNIYLKIFEDEIKDLIFSQSKIIAHYMDTKKLKETYKLYKSNLDYEKYGHLLWKAFIINTWLKKPYKVQ